MSTPFKQLFCFGLGFSGQALARLALTNGWTVCGTVRTEEKAQRLRAQGINAFAFDASTAPALSGEVISALHQSTHILQSIGTAKSGNDPLLPLIQPVAPALQPQWAGVLIDDRGLRRLARGIGR